MNIEARNNTNIFPFSSTSQKSHLAKITNSAPSCPRKQSLPGARVGLRLEIDAGHCSPQAGRGRAQDPVGAGIQGPRRFW